MTTISIRLNDKEKELFKSYSEFTGRTLSDLFKSSLAQHIEDELDYKTGLEALEQYKNNPIAYSIDDILMELENEI